MEDFWIWAGVGFLAQLIDGSLGMAYGIFSTTALIHLGVPPTHATASVHAAEVFTCGASTAAHSRYRTIDWAVFRRLAFAGALGGILGALLVSSVPVNVLRIVVQIYLAAMGILVLKRAILGKMKPRPAKRLAGLGFLGGFIDASGGGGWGPVVVSRLMVTDMAPTKVVGTAIAAELVMTTAVSIVFFATLEFEFTWIVAGLIAGGVVAAPIAAKLAVRAPVRPLMGVVGLVIMAVSLIGLYSSFHAF